MAMNNPFQKASRSQVFLKLAITGRKVSNIPIGNLIYQNSVPVDSGCWEWIGALNGQTGYAAFGYRGERLTGHRASFEAFNGSIPDGMFVRHTCDNRKCVKPDHLILGTPQQNSQDCVDRGRYNYTAKACGSKQHLAKLTDDLVREIKVRISSGESCYSLGKVYGVARITISAIKRGRTWRHVV